MYDEEGTSSHSTQQAAVASRELVTPRESVPADIPLLMVTLTSFFQSMDDDGRKMSSRDRAIAFMQTFAGTCIQVPIDEVVESLRVGMKAAEIAATHPDPFKRLTTLGNHHDMKAKEVAAVAERHLELYHRTDPAVMLAEHSRIGLEAAIETERTPEPEDTATETRQETSPEPAPPVEP